MTDVDAAAFRLPTEPYPGLRPFLDHEAALLQGRAPQVREVLKRLAQTRFVAVVGGSGSGKSSLIRAGVVPKLRGHGIPEAGDYWVPVVCTPGTAQGDATSPIQRLAWKFSRALVPLATPADEDARRDEIATVFRQGAGFARLVDGYHDELPPLGPDREEARFLFVIDQFEELFHPHNQGKADARCMVEAVISHFFNPHPRCYVVMTMRSEHLADCAAYLDLPDAINRSLYLVRRLGDAELRDAIVGPARYFLRLRQRGNAGGTLALPDDVDVDRAVIDRLLDDVRDIVADPDHLPLLQHILARCWEAACEREAVPEGGVPARVSWDDLERAASPTGPAGHPTALPGWLAQRDHLNVLRSSLDRWAQWTYEQRTPAQRQRLDAVLRELAYRDPNNGLYFQQRLQLDRLPATGDGGGGGGGGGEPLTPDTLRALLEHGFLDSVNYLFWDKEDPLHQTLKVSHEAFIRGWDHFRLLIDAEAERFEEFVTVLRKCALWIGHRDPALLLEPAELLRLEAAGLDDVLGQPEPRRHWFRILLQHRDGRRFAALEPEVEAFIAASRAQREAEARAVREAAEREREREARLREAQAEEKQARALGRRNLVAGVAVGIIAAGALFLVLVQAPVLASVEQFAKARMLNELRTAGVAPPHDGASAQQLGTLLEAAEQIRQAQAGSNFLYAGWMKPFLLLPPVDRAKRQFEIASSEPAVNGSLRQLLTTALWRSSWQPTRLAPEQRLVPTMMRLPCSVPSAAGAAGTVRPGTLFIDDTSRRPGAMRRAVFVPDHTAPGVPWEIGLHPVLSFDERQCTAGPQFWSVPLYLQPRILVDARVRYLALAVGSSDYGTPSVTLYDIVWTIGPDDRIAGAKLAPRSVITDSTALDAVHKEFDSPSPDTVLHDHVAGVLTWREPAGYGFSVAGQSWRLLVENATLMPALPPASRWVRLQPAAASHACGRLARALRERLQPGFVSTLYPSGRLCIEVKRGLPVDRGRGQQAPAPSTDRQQVLVALYDPQHFEALHPLASRLPPGAIATLVAFERRRIEGEDEWFIAADGPFDGWIATRRSGEAAYTGAPLTTGALVQLGQQVHRLAQDAASRRVSAR